MPLSQEDRVREKGPIVL